CGIELDGGIVVVRLGPIDERSNRDGARAVAGWLHGDGLLDGVQVVRVSLARRLIKLSPNRHLAGDASHDVRIARDGRGIRNDVAAALKVVVHVELRGAEGRRAGCGPRLPPDVGEAHRRDAVIRPDAAPELPWRVRPLRAVPAIDERVVLEGYALARADAPR